ncbi:MAG: C4-type zinc ribbon domain-containing protein [Spirochaetaceae bacterium]|jgi:predicted  nucleic acid-binding Zn-ribbon protein|nr:C4-type zinc ribbon domain-containing protein [Spirochaetaceae bacterium]
MDTTEIFDKLKTLQDILVQKYDLENKIEASPKHLQSQDELLSRLKKEYIEHSAEFDAKKDEVNRLKYELQEAEASRERGEKGMDTITTHREYEALDKEIKDATDQEQRIRKDLQREEKNLAEINDRLKQDEEFIQSQEAELASGRESLSLEVGDYKAKLAELTAQEQETNTSIDQEIIFKFERIIKSKQGKGIVAVKGNVCDGCHMILPAQFANKVRSGEEIVFCPYCSRILYYQELDQDEAEYFHVEETGSLADLDTDFGEDELDEEEDEVLNDSADESGKDMMEYDE